MPADRWGGQKYVVSSAHRCCSMHICLNIDIRPRVGQTDWCFGTR